MEQVTFGGAEGNTLKRMPEADSRCGFGDSALIAASVLVGPVWLLWRRRLYRGRRRPLSRGERTAFAGFFDESLLERTRVTVVPRIADPIVFRLLRALRIALPNSLETMAGMAIIDTVVIASGHRLVRGRGDNMALLFHELVHLVQFRLLGVRGMVRRYVRGWAEAGYDYWSIPLEEDAYELGGRFAANPRDVFCVEDEVRRRLGLAQRA